MKSKLSNIKRNNSNSNSTSNSNKNKNKNDSSIGIQPINSLHGNSLFNVWRKKPNSVDSNGNKLSLVNCNITNIDHVPDILAKKIKILYLSNNYISDLNNIKQFTYLNTLSITNNCIHYIYQLHGLKQCVNLVNLTINDNKVTKMPFFREYIYYCCPKLTLLNGIKVQNISNNIPNAPNIPNTNTYKYSNIISVINSFKYQINQLCLNELRVCILTHWNQLLKCHIQLISVVVGGFRSVRGKHIATTTTSTTTTTSAIHAYKNNENQPQPQYRSSKIGVHMLLQITLYGGVYKYLQSHCYSQYYTSVQDLCYRKSEFILKGKRITQPTYYKNSSIAYSGYNNYYGDTSSEYWNKILSSILTDQQQYIFGIASECEVSVYTQNGSNMDFDGSNTINTINTSNTTNTTNTGIDNKTTHSTIMNCLQQIDFEVNESVFHWLRWQ